MPDDVFHHLPPRALPETNYKGIDIAAFLRRSLTVDISFCGVVARMNISPQYLSVVCVWRDQSAPFCHDIELHIVSRYRWVQYNLQYVTYLSLLTSYAYTGAWNIDMILSSTIRT